MSARDGARHADRAVLVVNAASRSGRQAFDEACRRLRDGGVDLADSRAVEDPEQIPAVVEALVADGADLVVLGGGDGTVNCIASVIDHDEVVLGLLPLGTANDFARTLAIPDDLAGACRTIVSGRVVDVDLGSLGDHRFVNVTQLGLAVGVTRLMDDRTKKLLGPFAYPLTALRAFSRQRPFSARLEFPDHDVDDVELDDLLQLAVGSGVFYGGGNAVSSDASIDDHRLDVYAIPRGTWRQRWHVLRWFRSGRFVEIDEVFHTRTTRVRVFAKPPQSLNIDGELVEYHEVASNEFHVLPDALRVVIPQASDAARLDG